MQPTDQAGSEQPDFKHGVNYCFSGALCLRQSRTLIKEDGVLGGFGDSTSVPRIDALSSRIFLLSLIPALSTIVPPHLSSIPERTRPFKALDAGAGIGRVTKNTLLPLFDRVDLVESSSHFLQKAVYDAESWSGVKQKTKGVRFWQNGLQYFNPNAPTETFAKNKGATTDWEDGYDLIWIQWVIGHLSDPDFVLFLQRCRKALRKDGYICVKENITRNTDSLWDEQDSSITRSDARFKRCFLAAGLYLVCEETQKGFPAELFPVKTWALLCYASVFSVAGMLYNDDQSLKTPIETPKDVQTTSAEHLRPTA